MESRRQIDAILDEMNRVSLESVEAPPAKHRRERYSGDFSAEGPFDQLPDELKEEILGRLPLRSVLRSKSVCKEWLSLATSPRFLRHLDRRNSLLEKDHPVGLLLQRTLTYGDQCFVVCSGESESKCFPYSFEFLPPLRRSDYENVISLRGSCDDLLLCCSQDLVEKDCFKVNSVEKDYFIVNSVTRKWAALPPILGERSNVVTGLVCDPTSVGEAKKGGNLRFRAVRMLIPEPSDTELKVEIFSSEDGRWNQYVMRFEARHGIANSSKFGVAFNGSLYWKALNLGNIIALNPFKPMEKELVVIEGPPERFHRDLRQEHLGVHGGKLRMCHVHGSLEGIYEHPCSLKIWELEEAAAEGDGGARWRCVKVVSTVAISGVNCSCVFSLKSGFMHWQWRTLALHPFDGDVIYLGWRNVIFSCNLKTRRLKYVCAFNLLEWAPNYSVAFPIVLPWCPTPLPAMPKL